MTQRPPTLDGSRPSPIVQAAVRGERSAMESIWHEHRRWIAAVILAHKPRSVDLEDLLQEVAMALVTKIHTLHEAGNVKAWLRTVAVNAARAAGRTERSRPMLRLSEVEDQWRLPTACSNGEMHDSENILDLVHNLPETYREPLLLKAVQGMRTRQIAEILELPEATIDTRISRARRMLREQVNSENVSSHSGHGGHTIHLNGMNTGSTTS